MSKRTSGGVVKSDDINKLVSAFEQSITSADRKSCAHIQSKLENLLKLTKDRREKLDNKAKKEGLNYKGEDEVKCGCGCGNTFKSSGEYAVICDACANETCKECVKECRNDDCSVNLCSECSTSCSGCNKSFCDEHIAMCDRCEEQFCDGSRDCSLIDAGYGSYIACIECLGRR